MPYEFIARNGLIAQNNSIITGSLTVTGTITATTLVAQTITSSTSWITGSTKFGSTTSNTHQFTGSILQSGSLAYFAGDVGIGTTSPATKLHVSKTDGSNELIAIRTQNNLGYSEFGIQSNYARILANGALLYAGSDGAQFHYYNGSVVMTIGTGNVGICTTSPSTKLHL